MKLANLLASPMQHCEDATAHLLTALKFKFTRPYLQKELVEHPNYPSPAAIADVIGISYDISCSPLQLTNIKNHKKIPGFNIPFLAQIKPKSLHHEVFAVIIKFSGDDIELYNPETKKQESYTVNSFNEIYQGRVLAVEAGKKTQEDDYENNLKKEKQENLFKSLALFALPVITLLICGLYIIYNPTVSAVAPVVYTLLTLAGTVITTLLLWHEIDQYNPVVKQICQASAKVNCSAVLNSKAAKIKGLSWSSLGFVFFTGVLLSLLINGLSTSSLTGAAWVSALSLPYVFYSVYYQWKIVKQWCLLCLMVQGLLILLLVTALAGGFYNFSFWESVVQSWTGIVVTFAFVFTVIIVLMPALQKAKEERRKTTELQRMKHNPQIFEGVLAKQKELAKPADGLGITIGKPDAIYKLIKVCNPYCGPCAKAHPVMEELVENNEEVSIQIIFTATENEKDMTRAPAMHLMAVAAQNDEALTKQALDDWYLADKKDYKVFADKYSAFLPSPGGAGVGQIEAIKAMREWCDAVNITATPTFFVCMNTHNEEPDDLASPNKTTFPHSFSTGEGGQRPDEAEKLGSLSANRRMRYYRLPDMYTIADLKYFFTV